jgi:hypothetical protein
MILPRLSVVAVFLTCAGISVGQQEPSLKEVARTRGGTASRVLFLEFPVMSLRELTAKADLVVHAKVVKQHTTLNRDQTLVMTEYVLTPLRIPIAREAETASRPGGIKIIVRRPGGELVVDGLTLSTDVDAYSADAAIKTGEEAIFFLNRKEDGPVYEPVGGPFGIFRVTRGHVHALTDSVVRRRKDKPVMLSAFLAEVDNLRNEAARR